jgi:hypothetical protein
MKILCVCYDDYANFMHENAKSMRSVGLECIDVKLKRHIFNYASESQIVTHNELIKLIPHAEVIIFYHSNINVFKLIHGFAKGKIIAFHTGTLYRNNPQGMNEIFSPCVMSLTDQCEFMMTGYNNYKWYYVATAIDIDKLYTSKYVDKPYKFAHYPSKPQVKGSETINTIMSGINANYIYSDKLVPHNDQLKRISECDIYIEMFAPTQNGNPYGCYGVTSFEAAAFGRIVITQNIYPNVYKDAYGITEFMICNTEQELSDTIRTLNDSPAEEIRQKQQNTRKWLVENHSYSATGERMKKLLSLV